MDDPLKKIWDAMHNLVFPMQEMAMFGEGLEEVYEGQFFVTDGKIAMSVIMAVFEDGKMKVIEEGTKEVFVFSQSIVTEIDLEQGVISLQYGALSIFM
jgi:hypothetical protein